MNVDVVPDANEAMDTTALPTAEKRKPFSVRQSKAKRRNQNHQRRRRENFRKTHPQPPNHPKQEE